MKSQNLTGRQVAVLVADGFPHAAYDEIVQEMSSAGAAVHLVTPTLGSRGHVLADDGRGGTLEVPADVPLETSVASSYDGLILPGGRASVNAIADDQRTRQFIASFFESGRPVVAIDEAVGLVALAGLAKGRTVAADSALRTTLEQNEVSVTDESMHVDRGLITCWHCSDHTAVYRAAREAIAEVPAHKDHMYDSLTLSAR